MHCRATKCNSFGPQTIEAEWFAFDGRIYRRERTAPVIQRLAVAGSHAAAPDPSARFSASRKSNADRKPSRACVRRRRRLSIASDAYASASVMPNAPVFRVVCAGDWFYIDGASGALLEKLDSSRRAYRWLFGALHP